MHYNNREPRFYASIGFDQGIYYGNGKNDFESCNYTNFLNLGWSGYQGGSSYSITGYAPKKMASYKNGVTNSTIAEPGIILFLLFVWLISICFMRKH